MSAHTCHSPPCPPNWCVICGSCAACHAEVACVCERLRVSSGLPLDADELVSEVMPVRFPPVREEP